MASLRKLDVVRLGGLSLIVGALAFVAVFIYLAVRFNYPNVLDGSADDVLPRLAATGFRGRAAWAIYGLLPLFWIPAGVGAFHALRHTGEGRMRVAMFFAFLSSVAMMLGLMRWPSIHWTLAGAYASGGVDERALISAIFSALNVYLGNYVGEFLGELAINIFFLLSGAALLDRRSGFPQWSGYFGLVAAVAGILGMFRNVTDWVDIVAELNNYLLPVWMIVFGVLLYRRPEQAAQVAGEA